MVIGSPSNLRNLRAGLCDPVGQRPHHKTFSTHSSGDTASNPSDRRPAYQLLESHPALALAAAQLLNFAPLVGQEPTCGGGSRPFAGCVALATRVVVISGSLGANLHTLVLGCNPLRPPTPRIATATRRLSLRLVGRRASSFLDASLSLVRCLCLTVAIPFVFSLCLAALCEAARACRAGTTVLPTEPSLDVAGGRQHTSGTSFWVGSSEVECGYTTTASPWSSSLGLAGSVELDPMHAAAAWGRKYYSSTAASRMFPALHHHHHQDAAGAAVGLPHHHHHHHHQPRGPAVGVGVLKEEPLSGSQLAARSWMQTGVDHTRGDSPQSSSRLDLVSGPHWLEPVSFLEVTSLWKS
ncbi:hypothetical protein V9T40_010677 [Parthenolecanium corni]|uniref:Uncharacterized protein n=1 Tax=Parthenolecanium corni TaxID=536013 RepID=A0AAN9T5M6_9HEMI